MQLLSRSKVYITFSLFLLCAVSVTLLASNRSIAQAASLSSTSSQLSGTTNWPMFGFNAQHTGFNPNEHILSPNNVAGLKLDWSVNAGYIRGSAPVVVNGVVYVGTWEHNLEAFNAMTGATLWTASIGGGI